MTTYTVGSPEYAAACELAEEQIRDDMKAGAVEQYIDGESAQEALGEIIRINNQHRVPGEGVTEWLSRIGTDLDSYITRIVNEAVENNVARVAQENQQ